MRRDTEESIRCALFVSVIYFYVGGACLLAADAGIWWGIAGLAIGIFPVMKALYVLLMGKRWTG